MTLFTVAAPLLLAAAVMEGWEKGWVIFLGSTLGIAYLLT